MQNLIDSDLIGFKAVSFELKDFKKLKSNSKRIKYAFAINFIQNIKKQIIEVDFHLIAFEEKDNSPAKLDFKSLSQFKVPEHYSKIDIEKLDTVILSYLFSKSYSMVIGYLTSKIEGSSWKQDDLPKIDAVSVANHFKSSRSKKNFPLGEQIISLLDKSKNEVAIAILKHEIKERESTNAYLLLGTIYSDIVNEQDKAIDSFKKALALDPSETSIYANIGNCYFNKKNYLEAISYYSEAINYHPANSTFRHLRGVCFYYLGDFQRVIDDLTICIEFGLKNQQVYEILAYASREQKEILKALEYYHKIVGNDINEIKDEYISFYLNIGATYCTLRQFDKSKIYYQKAQKINDKHINLWNDFGILYFETKEYEKAINAFKKEITNHPLQYSAWGGLATVYATLGQFQNALNALLEYINIKPDFPDVWNNLGKIYFQLGEHSKAIESYNKAIVLHGTETNNALAEAYNGIGFSAVMLGQFEKAKPALLKAIELGFKDYGYCNLGHVLFLEGNEKAALDAYLESYKANDLKEENGFWKMFEGDFEVLNKQGITEKKYAEMRKKIKEAIKHRSKKERK